MPHSDSDDLMQGYHVSSIQKAPPKFILSTAAGSPVPRVGLGCMGMSEFYGVRDDEASLRVLQSAFELGYRHFDTADFYGEGHNEGLLGKFLNRLGGRRKDVFIATKCGIRRLPGPKPTLQIDSRPEYVREACHASLRRLGTDYVDLLFLHRRSAEVPIEDTMGALSELVAQGKCRHVGLSEVSEATLRRAHAAYPITALQSEYSLWTQDADAGVLDATLALGAAFVAYSPIGRGFLSGSLTREKIQEEGDLRGRLPRFSGANFEQNAALLEDLRSVAAELGDVTLSQVAIAWVLSRAPNVYTIPGTRRLEHLRGNATAEALRLTSAQVERLRAAFSGDAVAGLRYPEALMSTVNT